MNTPKLARKSDIALLHLEMQRPVRALAEALALAYQANITQFRFEIFETYRSPERQDYLFANKTTKARAGQSPHNFGMAVDFVPLLSQQEAAGLGVAKGWYWPELEHSDWQVLGELAVDHGLTRPLAWDKPHVEFPNWKTYRKQWPVA